MKHPTRRWLLRLFVAFSLAIMGITAWVTFQVKTYPIREQQRIESLCLDVVEKQQYDPSGTLYEILDSPDRPYTKLIPGTNLLIIGESDGKLHIKLIFCDLDGQFLHVADRVSWTDLHFTPDEQELFVTYWNGNVSRIQVDPFEILDAYIFCNDTGCRRPSQLAFHPTAPLIAYAIGSYDEDTESIFSDVYLFNIEVGENLTHVDQLDGSVQQLRFSDDGGYLQADVTEDYQATIHYEWKILDYQHLES